MSEASRGPTDAGIDKPYIPASESLPEITVKAVALGVILSVLLAGANTYLGLLAGMTVSASIPAAIISMAVLRAFRRSNILENNIVQTSASAGESLAAGVLFTIPALVLLNKWSEFHYWQTTLVAVVGGLIGVLFTIPLRRALIIESPLRFPEGVATAEVLEVGDRGGRGIGMMLVAVLVGALFKLGATGLKLWGDAAKFGVYAGRSVVSAGVGLSPALVAVGYIVGMRIGVLVFLGGAINWLIAIPIVTAFQGTPENLSALDAAEGVWADQTRYLGVGAMLVGGVWALLKMGRSVFGGIRASLAAYRDLHASEDALLERTDRDVPIHWVAGMLAFAAIPLFFISYHATASVAVGLLMTVVMLAAGFLFSAIAAYMAGVVGSSNNPISGVTITTILIAALLLLVLGVGDRGPVAAILIGGVVCSAAAIGGDNMQDLKAGRLVGATPWKQQVMQTVGVISAAFVMAPLLSLLHKSYVIGSAGFPAPQAKLIAAVTEGVFQKKLPWAMIGIGAGIAAIIVVLDLLLEWKAHQFRMPVLAVAVGIYLPFWLSVPIFIGGLIGWLGHRRLRRENWPVEAAARRNATLVAAGLITGEALLGILLAIPIVISGREDVLAFWGKHSGPIPGLVLLAGVGVWINLVAGGRIARPVDETDY